VGVLEDERDRLEKLTGGKVVEVMASGKHVDWVIRIKRR